MSQQLKDALDDYRFVLLYIFCEQIYLLLIFLIHRVKTILEGFFKLTKK